MRPSPRIAKAFVAIEEAPAMASDLEVVLELGDMEDDAQARGAKPGSELALQSREVDEHDATRGRAAGTPYLVAELLHGETLSRWVQRNQGAIDAPSVAERLRFAREVSPPAKFAPVSTGINEHHAPAESRGGAPTPPGERRRLSAASRAREPVRRLRRPLTPLRATVQGRYGVGARASVISVEMGPWDSGGITRSPRPDPVRTRRRSPGADLHRYVKPANVFLSETPVPWRRTISKLLDWGLAKAPPELRQNSPRVVAALPADQPVETDRLTAIGTPGYIPPEACGRADRFDVRSEVFALGMVLYETITGALPRTAEALQSLSTDAKTSARFMLRLPREKRSFVAINPALRADLVGVCSSRPRAPLDVGP